jgi:transcription termination factor Rho
MSDSDPSLAAPSGETSPEAPAPKRPRSRARRGPVAATPEEMPATAPEKPARRPRKTAARKSADAASEPAAPAPKPAPAPAEPAPPPREPAAADSAPAPTQAPAESADKPSPPRDPSPEPVADSSGGEPNGNAAGGGAEGDDEREPWWKRKKDRKKNKKGKWKDKGGDRPDRPERGERPPPQPLPPGESAVNLGSLPDPARFEDLAALDARAEAAAALTAEPIRLHQLYPLKTAELADYARRLGVVLEGVPGRWQWLQAIFRLAREQSRPVEDRGWLDLTEGGDAFIVHDHVNYRLYPENAYVPAGLIKRYGLKRGHLLTVRVAPPEEGERCPSVLGVTTAMGRDPGEIAAITPFEELEPYYPLKRIMLEANEIHKDISMRAVDLLTPVGFGQRGLIVAPPRTGKTVLLQNMANSISRNFPDVKLLLLLIDERPEEVTDFRRHTKGEVVSSTFDEAPASHVHAAEMVIEKARRLCEIGEHVVILLDSITRLARAYNALASNSGKIMSGGVEATALQKPKRFFGSARNIEGGGSITILGTALIDTGSRMDEVIFEEFKGTGNMELHLDRGLSDKRIFPAINIDRSGTRKEELIYHPDEMLRVYGLRRAMQGLPPVEAMEMFITRLKKTKSNAEFLMSLNR